MDGGGGAFSLIYIPIWLDLLFPIDHKVPKIFPDLHSNMVRFIIIAEPQKSILAPRFTFQYG